MLVKREIYNELHEVASQYPVVTITGPRQSGKTTLARIAFPEYAYFSFENPDTRDQVQNDPRAFLEMNKAGVIIDEFQHYPEILSFIQGEVDRVNKKGHFILTGSNQLSMIDKINQSLAGRTALLKLLPFTISEAEKISGSLNANQLILNGFYPGIYSNSLNPYKAYRNYYETYIERDVRRLSNLQNLRQFQLFMRLCAGRIGQIFNAASLAGEIGVSIPTIKHWLSILEASFVVFMLSPWHANLNKRIVKSPKLYFYDVGLASFLLSIEKEEYLQTHPLRGALFENMVLMEFVKKRYNSGLDSNLYFYRDNHGNEVDIIQEQGHLLNIYEIKSSTTFHSGFLKGLEYLKKLLPERIIQSSLVYAGEDMASIKENKITNFRNIFT